MLAFLITMGRLLLTDTGGCGAGGGTARFEAWGDAIRDEGYEASLGFSEICE